MDVGFQNSFQQDVQVGEVIGNFVFGNFLGGEIGQLAERTSAIHDIPVGYLNGEVVFRTFFATAVNTFQHRYHLGEKSELVT